jgi:hypothetical protein
MPGLRVLVVDDEKVIADTLVQILTQGGFTAAVAYSGEHAIHCARDDHFDVVLMDVMMPEMNGIEAIRSTPMPNHFSVRKHGHRTARVGCLRPWNEIRDSYKTRASARTY